METDPRQALIRQIEAALLARPMGQVHLSLASGAGAHRQAAHFRCWPFPVLQCVVSGRIPMVLRDRTGERAVVLRSGDCCYSVPNGWDVRDYGTRRRLLVCEFHPTHVLVRLARHHAAQQPGSLPMLAYHTRLPLPVEGQAMLQALNENALRRGDANAAWHLLHALGRLVVHLLREDRPAIATGETRTYGMLMDYVRVHAERPINRNEVAAAVGLAPDHVSRLFAAQGERFTHVLNRLRLERAAALLRLEPSPLRDIARRCGFTTDNYFVKAFRRHFGVTPGTYRGLGPDGGT